MKLSIIITHYDEGERVVFPLLSSISNQIGVDFGEFEVIVVNDCSDVPLTDDFLTSFPNIKPRAVLLKENIGLASARNAGFAESTGEYVMYCDADDSFFNYTALFAFLEVVKNQKYDCVFSTFIEEVRTPEGVKFINHNGESTWVHGKIFRRQFLLDNDIRFPDGYRTHEDSYFTGICYELATNNRNFFAIPACTYVWRWNDNSMVRRNNGEFIVTENTSFIQSINKLCEDLEKKNDKNVMLKAVSFIIHEYFTLQDARFYSEQYNSHYIESMRLLKKFMKRFGKYWYLIEKEPFAEIYAGKKDRFNVKEYKFSLKDFIQTIS